MLKMAILFFTMGLFVFVLGLWETAGVSFAAGKVLLVVFGLFSLISFVAGITFSKTRDRISL